MTPAFVDSDVIIRLVAGDDPAKLIVATRLFEAVEHGTQTLQCPVTAVADAVYVLTSPRLYSLDRSLVASALMALVDFPQFRVSQKPVVRRALEIYADSRLDFGDAMLIAEMEDSGVTMLYSYDRDFDRIATVRRREP